MITFVGCYCRFGSEIRKRDRNKPVVLHNHRFTWRKRVVLSNDFVKESGLFDPGRRNKVILELKDKYGIIVDVRGAVVPRIQESPISNVKVDSVDIPVDLG